MNLKLPNGGVAKGTPRKASIGSNDPSGCDPDVDDDGIGDVGLDIVWPDDDTLWLLLLVMLMESVDDDVDVDWNGDRGGDVDDADDDEDGVFGVVMSIPRKNPYFVLTWRGDSVLSKTEDNGEGETSKENVAGDNDGGKEEKEEADGGDDIDDDPEDAAAES